MYNTETIEGRANIEYSAYLCGYDDARANDNKGLELDPTAYNLEDFVVGDMELAQQIWVMGYQKGIRSANDR